MGKNSQLVIRCYTRPRAPRAPRPCYVSKTGSALIEQKIFDLAKKLAFDPLVLVIGLLARMRADRDRSAARIARAIFGKRPRREVDEAAATLGIQ
ncbi:MAG TPA: hypothetical protein VKB84_05390 [Candidatus Binataceae bacterium]|nr:hypothetical protein [Candidatus Binataceae bacterium]